MENRPKPKEIFLGFSKEFRKAVFGSLHLAFVTKDEDYILCEEDLPSLQATLAFYQDEILKRKTYPVFSSSGFVMKNVRDETVLSEILGLPEELFRSLDLTQDILSQLKFRKGLYSLKRECYLQRAEYDQSKWYHDDFRLYCLCHGLFFLYDETKPFLEEENPNLPIYLKEDRIEGLIAEKMSSFGYERLCIDACLLDVSDAFFDFMKAMDDFPFQKRISYFVNGDYDPELAAKIQCPEYRNRYKKILKEWIVSLVNRFYDLYSENVLCVPTEKTSYLTPSLIHTSKKRYSVSSFGGEMFLVDGKWNFPSYAKKTIFENAMGLVFDGSLYNKLRNYMLLKLPYYGYLNVRDKEVKNADELIDALPFSDEITSKEWYLASKRYDSFYCYSSLREEHRMVLCQRYLLSKGIDFSPLVGVLSLEGKFTLKVKPCERKGILYDIFDRHSYSLTEEVFPSYLLFYGKLSDENLKNALLDLDEISSGSACFLFFSSIGNVTIEEACERVLAQFDRMKYLSSVLPFFRYLIRYLFLVASVSFRNDILDSKECGLLEVMDEIPDSADSYEPCLCYPYVEKGGCFYSFRKTPDSKPYLPLIHFSALKNRIIYFLNLYDDVFQNGKKTIRMKGETLSFVIDHLGLPENIVSLIPLSKEYSISSLLQTIPMKEGISHLEQGGEPVNYDSVDEYRGESYNINSIYRKANCAEQGIFLENRFKVHGNIQDFYSAIRSHTFHSLFDYSSKSLPSFLRPYLEFDRKGLAAILFCFGESGIDNMDYVEALNDFLAENMTAIRELMFAYRDKDFPLLSCHFYVMSMLYHIYQNLKMVCLTGVENDSSFSVYSLNYDYNPSLVYPYVLLGKRFNAYTENVEKGPYYFCECDRKAILDTLQNILNITMERSLPDEWKTVMILSELGLPFLVVLKMKYFDFDKNNAEDFVKMLSFRDSICRRCLSIAHAGYREPFVIAYPFKEDQIAEQRFAGEMMLKDGFYFYGYSHMLDNTSLVATFLLDNKIDLRLPLIVPLTDDIPEVIYRYLHPTKEEIKDDLYELSLVKTINQEALAYASGILLDSYIREEEVIADFAQDLFMDGTLREKVKNAFPEINRVRKEFQDATIEVILFYFTYLKKKIIRHYVDEERHIGR